ncbi:MAG: ABC transporter permease subunit [Planctomycetaceae bacterium]|nr:ABC transporter permease subunit [Planctomycetaceae bacterium]
MLEAVYRLPQINLLAQSHKLESTTDYNWLMVWICVAAIMAALVSFSYGTRAGVIARATTKEAIRQPLFFLLLLICGAVLGLNTIMPFFTLEDDVKMLKECGLATLLIAGALLAVWTAGTSITNEIDGKTAMTLLSKPINRRQFILGKFIGILQAVIWLFLPLTLLFATLIYYKVGYDQKERSEEVTPSVQWTQISEGVEIPMPHPDRLKVVNQVLPGIALSFLQVVVLAAISVTVATRLPMVVNLVVCFAIFVIGNLTPLMVQQSETVIQNEAVTFIARMFATVLPSLESFNVSAAISTGSVVPPKYLGFAFLYATAYATAVVLLGFILFEDRDLA